MSELLNDVPEMVHRSEKTELMKFYDEEIIMNLPDDYRKGIYTDECIIATVDVRWSRDEILMHDETNDGAFTVTPHELSLWKRIGTKINDNIYRKH